MVERFVLNILEAIRRKPLKQEIETYVTMAGVVIMVCLDASCDLE